jgi:AraC-like DNA-binding protein
LAKIALELERALAERAQSGAAPALTDSILAQGDGWTVRDVICTAGPGDRPFEELHSCVSIAVVAVGSFQYRSRSGQELMTPGALLLGNSGQFFECAHEHASGDRCLSFAYTPEYFERIVGDAGLRSGDAKFRVLRLPPLRDLSPLVTQVMTNLVRPAGAFPQHVLWEELALRLAAQTLRLSAGLPVEAAAISPADLARITRVVRRIEQQPAAPLTLATLARDARLSPYHFLRTFERLAGVTPHQYILRTRLREAALRLTDGSNKVLDIALDCGFGDISNFNRTFRAEFSCAPRAYARELVSTR